MHEFYNTQSEEERHHTRCDYKYHNVIAEGATGWIDPKGTLHGCEYGGHSSSIIIFNGITDHQADQAGWVKVCATRGRFFFYGKRMTSAQKRTLFDMGYNPDEY